MAASIGKGKLTGIEYVSATVRTLNDLLTEIDQLEKTEQSKADRAIDLYALGHESSTYNTQEGTWRAL